MPQKIHPNAGIGDARKPLKSMGFEVVSPVLLSTRVGEEPHLNLVGLRRSLVRHLVAKAGVEQGKKA
jgi:hypothetical protein